MKTKKRKKRLLQGVVPRGARTQNGSLSGASKSPFRANAPASLQQELQKRIREARWTEDAMIAMQMWMSRDIAQGERRALEKLERWLRTPKGKQALARNSDSATGG